MAVLFVSHSSKDDATPAGWRHGFAPAASPILSIDHSNIAGGDKWGQALRASAGACRVIMCLVTENWFASQECFGEFAAACYMGKRVIPLFLLQAPERSARSRETARTGSADYQGIDLDTCLRPDGTLDLGADTALSTA